MATKILIPTPLRPFTDRKDAVEVDGKTVGELLADLIARHSGLKAHLYNAEGKLRSFVNIYVNDEDIRYLQKEQTPINAGDTVSIIPSVAGGAPAAEAPAALPGAHQGRLQALQPPPDPAGSRRAGAAEAQGREDPVHRRRRPGIAGRAVSRRRGRRHDRHRGLRRRGFQQPAAADSARDDGRRASQARFREGPAARHQPEHRTSCTHNTALSSENALEIFAPYDIVVDGTDNFPTRYLVNDACVILGKPNAYGSIFRFEGQASVFATKDGPCYRCLYPEPPPPGLVPSCAEGGVLGVLPGVIGCIQATETIKLILGAGEPLIGRFLIFDALRMKFRELKLRKDPDCPVCGTHPTVTKLIDYEQFCGVQSATEEPVSGSSAEISAVDLKKRLDRGDVLTIVDVREPNEYQINRINGSVLIPLGDIPKRYVELDPNDEFVMQCKVGARSAKAADFLRSKGYKKVSNLTGGILEWIDKVDPSQPKY